ncbi:MAG: PhzF family phenazine biosynthesis protein [Actinomycetota bacterium]
MRIPLYQIDAFADRVFGGNPAAVCPLASWLADALLQAIAAENNLSETAFFIPTEETPRLRWFTPLAEVDLCGHATLAAAFVLFERLQPGRETVTFQSRSGPLTVTRSRDLLSLDFPALPLTAPLPTDALARALQTRPIEVRGGMDLLAVFGSQAEVRALKPDMERLKGLDCRGVIATAPGDEVDFVSRFFAPAVGIPEDPVTGSAHCALTPYWAGRLGKSTLRARQISRRGGELQCELIGERVRISGRAVLYLEGNIQLQGT